MDIKELKKIIKENEQSLASYLNVGQMIEELRQSAGLPVKRVAILSNFTVGGLGDCLKTRVLSHDIFLDIYEGAYGQWRQEILGDKLYQFNPDIIFLILDYVGFDHELYYTSASQTPTELNEFFNNYLKDIEALVDKIKSRSQAKIILSNLVDYWPKSSGISGSKQKSSLKNLIQKTNISLEEKYLSDQQVFIFDFDGWLGHIGKDKNLYNKFFFLADMRLSPEALILLAQELEAYLVPLAAKSRKCLVLDLDNTLWGGILGEDGLTGIKLAPTGEGQAYYLFQKLILSFFNRGIILAINSKNNLADVQELFAKHPDMILKEKHFAAIRINWQDKVTNMKELAAELNIGLDSLVFLDDDPVNRAMINEFLPEVAVIDLPTDAASYCRALLEYKGLNYFGFTEEDRQRGEMYAVDRQRKEFRTQAKDLDSFLKSLSLVVKIEQLSDLDLARAAQLTQKTNQFNLTTRRYQEEDIRKFLKQGDKIWTLRVSDCFGEYGLTGLAIIKDKGSNWEIDIFLLSCRVLGKRVEEQFLKFVLNELKKINSKKIIAKYLPTKKNELAKDFYQATGLTKTNESTSEIVFEINLKDFEYQPIDFISIN
jgi:FkbH-like protein